MDEEAVEGLDKETVKGRNVAGKIVLDVGGVLFHTTVTTLKAGDTYFSALMNHHVPGRPCFVDRDPTYFRHVLNWLRGVRSLPSDKDVLQELYWESDFYCVDDMKRRIAKML